MRNSTPLKDETRQHIELLRPGDAARHLGVTIRTFQRWVASGAQIPCVLTGKRRRYVKERLMDWAMNRDRRVV
jgi:excisionase family DNA binding protein